jgi:uncharacterized protein with HEPN domain
MAQHDDRVSIRQMLDHADEALQLASGRSRGELDSDRLFALALTRLLEILGEAASRVSPASRGNCPGIPWSSIVGLRNRLIHAYDQVDFDILWTIVENDLPPLAAQLRAVLGDE